MAKLTVTEIKKQIAALEAKAARLAEEETKASVAKVRALMSQLGVTLEHLSSVATKKAAAVKGAIIGKRGTPKRASKGAPKYQDPKTGATWSGFGRAPGWIVSAKTRDVFLVDKSGVKSPAAAVKVPAAKKKSAAKKASAKKVAGPAAKKAVPVAKKVGPPAPVKKKPSAKKTAAKKSAKKRAAPGSAPAGSTAPDVGAPSAT